jgi:O-antigen ligase
LNILVASTTSAFLFLIPFTGSAGLRSTVLILAAIFLAVSWRSNVAPYARRVPLALAATYAAWALLAVASLTWSVNPRYTLGELRAEVFYGTLVIAVFFLAAQKPDRWRRWCSVMLAGTVAVCVAYFIQTTLGISFSRHSVLEQGGPWSTHLVLITPIVLALAWPAPWGGRRGIVVSTAAMALLLYAAWKTENRIVWVALAAQFLIIGTVRPVDVNGSSRRLRRIAVAAAVVATVALAASIADRSAMQFAGAADSLEGDVRPRIWAVAWEKFMQAPVLGHGFGREILAADFAPHTPAVLNHPQIRHGHNVFVDTALENGVVGLAFFVLLLALLVREYGGYLRRPAIAPLGAIGLAVLVGFIAKSMTDDFLHRHNGLLFWALNAMLVGLGRGAEAPPATPRAEVAGRR